MRETLLLEIQAQNERIKEIGRQLKDIGYYVTREFFYEDGLERLSEPELVLYLIRKSKFYDYEYARMQQSQIGTMELFEVLGAAAPEEILGRVYDKQWVYDWVERVKEEDCTQEELLAYLRRTDDEQ